MLNNRIKIFGLAAVCVSYTACKIPEVTQRAENKNVPVNFGVTADTLNTSNAGWHSFFTDKNLVSLIETALKNNQELNITLQELEIAKNEVQIKKGELLPTVGLKAGAGIEKVGRYTSQGAGDASTEIAPGKETPDPLGDLSIGAYANWEVDIWKKLRTAKKAALTRYLSTVEGKNFVLSNLVAEVANSYYELLALDSQLAIVKQSIDLQKSAMQVVKIQKEAARATELAVQKFQAEVFKSQSLEFEINQQIKETENRINLLLGRYPQEIIRDNSDFLSSSPSVVHTGIPSQLLANRPDVRQAELDLAAAKLDVKVARTEFYPSFDIYAGLGFQAFKPSYLFRAPESLLYSLAGDLAAPLINRNAIKAEFKSANARQLQAIYNYERTVLNAYLEVSTSLSGISNLEKNYSLKVHQVDALNKSIEASNDLFRSARADYFEVLMTQRDALEAKLELVETKKNQFNAVTRIFRNIGGGWK